MPEAANEYLFWTNQHMLICQEWVEARTVEEKNFLRKEINKIKGHIRRTHPRREDLAGMEKAYTSKKSVSQKEKSPAGINEKELDKVLGD